MADNANGNSLDVDGAHLSTHLSESEYDMNVEEDIVRGECVIVPQVGMIFKDEKEMLDFYKRYAYEMGFPVRKRNSKKDDDGNLRYITLTCSREGRRSSITSTSLKPQPTIQTGCKARLTASSDSNGTWRINAVHLEHNHQTSPSKSRLYRCNRVLSAHVKRRLEVNDMAGIPLHKSYNSTVVEVGGYENTTFVEKDCRNYIEKVRRLRLGEGDAAAIQAYFSKMQATSSGFYFIMDLDDKSRLKNVFWADHRSREAYKEFGDVVTFDTTYLTNKYDMPFAPFVGVNHHGQSTLLGCGLLSNENTETFTWLFRTWLQCMNGRAPQGIITDQDRAMQNAIEIVFPNTKHRWCLWHILKKLPEKFGYHVDKDSIFSDIHGLVYDSQGPDEFEEGWGVMINTYDLHDNSWLSGLYQNRHRWVPCFLKTSFWAGMSTTQRSESMNAFFDGYVNSKTSLKQFVDQYEKALRHKVEKEFQADFKSYSQMVPCATMYELEKQFQDVYTISKFREFQIEFTGMIYCEVVSTQEEFLGTRFDVREDVIQYEYVKKKIFSVTLQRENCVVMCSCHLFEFRGILCRHIISVLIRNNIMTVPERYILRRWRRDVTRAHTRVTVNYNGLVSTPGQLRYEKMCQHFAKIADLAADDEERTRSIMDWIDIQDKELSIRKMSGRNFSIEDNQAQGGSIRDPKYSRRKGAPKKLRKKGPLESSSKKTNKTKGKVDASKGRRPNRIHLQEESSDVQAFVDEQESQPTQFSYSQLLMGEDDIHAFTQESVQASHYYNPYIRFEDGT